MANLSIESSVKLASGHELPLLGFGLYKTQAEECKEIVKEALQVGYRHFDSAVLYHNETETGAAIKAWIDANHGKREQVFYTTKLHRMTYDEAKAQIKTSVDSCGLGYIDLFLIHSPYGGPELRLGQWRALAEAVVAGQVRSIGVSNYGTQHLDELKEYIGSGKLSSEVAAVPISVGQWELHPWLQRPDICGWCKRENVAIEAYSPLTRGEKFKDPALAKVAEKLGRTPAQVLVRWSLQKGWVPLPKTATLKRIAENADVYNFEIEAADEQALDTDNYEVITWDPTVEPLHK